MDLNSIYPQSGNNDTSVKAQKLLDNLLVRTNFALKTRTALGWRGLHPAIKNGNGWTCKIKGAEGIYGIWLHSVAKSGHKYKIQYKLAYFPMPEEESRMFYAIETAILAGQEDYMNYVRNFTCYPHFLELFHIADIEFDIQKNKREKLKLSLKAHKSLKTISEKGIFSSHNGEKVCLVEPNGIDQNLPAYQLALPFFEILGATFTYNLLAAPTHIKYSNAITYPKKKRSNKKIPLEIQLFYSSQKVNNKQLLIDKNQPFTTLLAENANKSPFGKSQWWTSHLPKKNKLNAPISIDRPQLIILTGFLGSGKTSFLKNFIEYHTKNNRFVAVIQNEIGQKGVDSHLLEDSFGLVEVDEGCVCCSLVGQLRKGIYEVNKTYNPDIIILETTGLANPFNLLAEIEEIRDLIRFDSITTVVDALNVNQLMKESNILAEQIKAADIILLNKIDLVENKRLILIRNQIQSLNKNALILDCIKGDINPALLYIADKGEVNLKSSFRYHKNHIQENLESKKYELGSTISQSRFITFMQNLPNGIFRCKGRVAFSDIKTSYIFQYVNGRFELEEDFKKNKLEYYLIFIGQAETLSNLNFDNLK